jgi:tellurite resistance protein TehA-like permease
VNCSVTTIVGAVLKMPDWLTVGSFLLGLFLQITLVPPQVYRTVSNIEVSPSIATNMMQAPCSLNMITWGVMRRYKLHLPKQSSVLFGYGVNNKEGIQSKEFEDMMSHVLYFFSVLVVWLTVYCLFQRRESIRKAGFHPGWAVLTFPTCSSAVATLQYCGLTSKDLATPNLSLQNDIWRIILTYYGIGFSIVTCLIVLFVFVGFVINFGFVKTSHPMHQKVGQKGNDAISDSDISVEFGNLGSVSTSSNSDLNELVMMGADI